MSEGKRYVGKGEVKRKIKAGNICEGNLYAKEEKVKGKRRKEQYM